MMLAGYILQSKGWRPVHGTHGKLITDGLSACLRHPQYTGLFLVITGFLVQWPTYITALLDDPRKHFPVSGNTVAHPTEGCRLSDTH